jgi:potassium-transporting ATPase KdpC subunit
MNATTPNLNAATPPAAANNSVGSIIRAAAVLFIVFSLITGLAYPALVTTLAQWIFPASANGSLIVRDGKLIGSSLIGQSFTAPKYFWSRPSATTPMAYNASASSGSNLGPTSSALKEATLARVAALKAADPTNTALVPIDLVTASASGLDPHISRAAADYQVARVARERGLDIAKVTSFVERNTERPLLGFLGEPRVHVLNLNLALDDAR